MNKFEKKFGKYAIPNLSLVLIICYAFGFLIQMLNESFLYNYLTLNPYWILKGQIWRLFTWLIVPPFGYDLLSIVIMMIFYYSIGTTLERTWGTYRYNVYLFTGFIFTIIGSFIAYFSCVIYYGIASGGVLTANDMVNVFNLGFTMFSTYYVNMSIFLAFAATFPEAQVLLMFIIPIKVKYLGILYAIILVWEFLMGVSEPGFNIFYRIAILASLMNFIVFYIRAKRKIKISKSQKITRREFKQQTMQPRRVITKHKCAICGQTEENNPELEFRFCSKCNGNYEYCQHHLFTHEHVK